MVSKLKKKTMTIQAVKCYNLHVHVLADPQLCEYLSLENGTFSLYRGINTGFFFKGGKCGVVLIHVPV